MRAGRQSRHQPHLLGRLPAPGKRPRAGTAPPVSLSPCPPDPVPPVTHSSDSPENFLPSSWELYKLENRVRLEEETER